METETKLSSTNGIYTQTMKRLNSAGQIHRQDILNNFSPEAISSCWTVFSKAILRNYQSGKGTLIPKFGTFTFTSSELNLEGTTNPLQRDQKAKKPVFVVSSDFVERLKPGIHTTNGLIYYTQKKNNNTSHVKVNFSEMAFALNMKKDEIATVLENIIKFIGDSIVKNEFINKDMPGLGLLLVKNNIIAVKFNEDVTESVKLAAQKLVTTKKRMNLFMEMENKSQINNEKLKADNLPNLAKTFNSLRPKTAVITKITKGAEKWLKDYYDININELENQEEKLDLINNLGSEIKVNSSGIIGNQTNANIINDVKKTVVKVAKKLVDLNIPFSVLDSIGFHKGIIISEMKNLDKMNTGILKVNDFIYAMKKANIKDLSSQNINDIINLYNENRNQAVNNINYTNLIGKLLKDITNTKNLNEFCSSGNIIGDANSQTIINTTTFNSSNTMRPFSAHPGGAHPGSPGLPGLPGTSNKDSESTNPLSAVLSRKVELEEVHKEIKTIKIVIDKITAKNLTKLDQNISINEFRNILREYSIVFPEGKIEKILNFLEVGKINSFSLQEFTSKLNACKILSSEMKTEDILTLIKKLTDILFSLNGRALLFPNLSQQITSITKEDFISTLSAKSPFSKESLSAVYNFITKVERPFTIDDYCKTFESNLKTQLDEDFLIKAINIINERLFKVSMKHEEYFNHLLNYKKKRSEYFLSQTEFHKAFNAERFNFTAEEVDFLFKNLDTKRDNRIDKEEFVNALSKVFGALYKVKDIILKNRLEIEDLLFRMNIDKVNETFDFYKFKSKIKLLDSTFDNNFIKSLFDEMREGQDFVETNMITKHFNVYRKEHFRDTNNESFRLNFIEEIRTKGNYKELKELCEKIDSFNLGLLKKIDFCNIISKVTKEYKDEDIMKFVRITKLLLDDKVKYTPFLDMIFYTFNENKFTHCVKILMDHIKNSFNNDIGKFIKSTMKNETQKISYDSAKVDSVFDYIKFKLDENIDKNVVCKLDIDNDGRISVNDLKAIAERYNLTSFFKYNNESTNLDVNLFPEEEMDEEKFKQIVRDIKAAMKSKNITEIGLFNKLDQNRDSFVSHPEFCKNIDEIIRLSPGIKDQFFNYLDARKLGMVDLETFLKRFKEFKSADILVANNWDLEEDILNKFADWVEKNKAKLSVDELFLCLDYDCDGLVSAKDFRNFCLDRLNFSQYDLVESKLERVMQRLSLTKNKNIGLADINHFMSLSDKDQRDHSKLTFTNSNLNKGLKNQDWVSEAIVRLGLYISENYNNIEDFFTVFSNEGKLSIESFKKFLAKEHKCFEGFKFTTDEILTIYSALDPHKKNYVSLQDLKNKLANFDFYRKMHIDIKDFIKNNFKCSEEAFFYFKCDKTNHALDNYITKKEIFDGINVLFPGKFQTETILRYITKKFKLTDNLISFSEFNFLYYDDIKDIKDNKEENFLQLNSDISNNSHKNSKRPVLSAVNKNASSHRAVSAKLKTKAIPSAFDEDALEKIKRIINTSRFDYSNYFKMYELISDKGLVNQFEFRNMLKKLNLGLTNIEIDQISQKAGKTWDGKINIKDFYKFITTDESNLAQLKKNINSFISHFKQLIYKYYTSARLAYQYNDPNITNQMDLNKFKSLINDLYTRESSPLPNFSLVKHAFDFVDIRKDGNVDLNEWLRTFSKIESDLDIKNVANPTILKELRDWENSKDVSILYSLIAKNKKFIREKANTMMLVDKGVVKITAENLITVLKDVLSDININNSQWKIIVSIGDKEKNSLIDFDLFMKIVEQSNKQFTSHPYVKRTVK